MVNIVPAAALYNGPSRERIEEIRRLFFYDAGCDPWRGKKLGRYYGCMFHITRNGLIEVEYGEDGAALPLQAHV